MGVGKAAAADTAASAAGWQRQGQAGEVGEGGDRLAEEDYTE